MHKEPEELKKLNANNINDKKIRSIDASAGPLIHSQLSKFATIRHIQTVVTNTH